MTPSDNYTPLSEIDEIYTELTHGFNSRKTRSIEFRKKQLLQFAYMFHDNLERLMTAIHEDVGKPKQEAVGADIVPMIADTLWAYERIDEWVKPEQVEEHPVYSLFNPIMIKEPKGLGLITTAYNFPGYNSRGIPGIIASGCAMVWKPSEYTPKTNAILAELFPKYMDSTLYRLVQGAIPETEKLLSYQWGQILYVGSSRGGKACALAAAKTLSPITLELGSKSPCFVHTSATFEIAARSISWGRFSNAGQTCIGPDYVLVLEKDKDALVKAFLDVYKQFYGVNIKKSVSFMKAPGHFERVDKLLRETKGTILVGGDTDPEERYVAPTIIVDLDWDDPLMKEEIFGPIITIVGVSSYEAAFEKIKKYGDPLTAYLYHNDVQMADYVRDNVSSGTWVENETLFAHIAVTVPLCGKGNSGMGRGYKGKTSFMEFTHLRPCCRVPEGLESTPIVQGRYPPYSEETLAGTIIVVCKIVYRAVIFVSSI